ncbi:ribosome small subunit-dependent GTPase A [Corynebacterium sanguinis]|uniref:Ribosome small subunit-dependent GTPase A n=1 Tax=Corynebacterium sanguinis TaxID=2594913 RepID=A0A6C1U441_9CORY|nr:ribosome small subunit-dependent GTPase A [Corynebacterium sanguinis]MBA4505028.1 ribosome small subunit-dependent GTPase A [Corynebacterium sanguinis]MCT1462872.1 ribosome small subunit-dependent GTPase A [Corynebacterium sanguinis]MCT1584348.1 ribosome small subunit-dependent GTPase A [Corynebacterium sanguinis]MCT1663683.1 ribosome small subunit-dependent GTPase A [Corynebacterium sanguinis]MCT1882638.1 ribosome small subunit-dependent GTPase A [Corynebacterium sanguinis]
MARRFSDYDESDVRVRPGKGSRPRSKDRPSHDDAVGGMVVTKDRGRWGVVLDDTGAVVQCMRARELKKVSVEVGDRVGVVGDTSGDKDTLARIVKREDRTSVLRRTADDTDPYERIIVANAQLLLIVSAVADPPPRTGFVERALIAAFVGGVTPIVCLTKSDLADPAIFRAELEDLDVDVMEVGIDDDIKQLTKRITGRLSALIGHSGVGKSTLVNRIVPDANRETGEVSGVGKGRHTSTQSVALELPGGGWIIDTPGIRSFGLAHVSPDEIVGVFPELAAAAEDCPRGCTHLGPPADPECAWDELDHSSPVGRRARAVRRLLEALHSNNEWELKQLDDKR